MSGSCRRYGMITCYKTIPGHLCFFRREYHDLHTYAAGTVTGRPDYPADHRHHPVSGRRFFPASIKKGGSTGRQPLTLTFLQTSNFKLSFSSTIFPRPASLPHCRSCYEWGIIIIMIHRRSDQGETDDGCRA